jgi:hypothetical protein
VSRFTRLLIMYGRSQQPDPSVVQACGRAVFRVTDLLALTHLLQRIDQVQKEEEKC